MKQSLFFILIFTTTFVFGQNNDIESQILKYEDSKSAIISKGRNLLLDKFIENDFEKVKEIRRYLVTEVEDKDYIALYPIENWTILYWTREYDELLHDIGSYDSTRIMSYQTKIHPNNYMLGFRLEKISIEHADTIREQIKSAELSSEQKDFLLLNFEYFITDTKANGYALDTLNNLADEFFKAYPDSKYTDFTRKYIREKFVPKNWGFAFEFFSGYSFFTGTLHNNYTNNVPLGISFDICYKKFELYLRDYIGFNQTKKDFDYSLGTHKKGSRTMVFLPEASLGYAALDNDRFKISPFAGIGGLDIGATMNAIENTPELKEVSLKFTTTYILGFNFDIKLGEKKPPVSKPKTNYGFIRIRYAYAMPQFEKKYDGITGNMHYITIGIGGFARGTKREY